MAGLGAIGAIASLAGTVVSAVGTIAAGQAAKTQAEWQAQQHEVAAKEEKASAFKQAQELTHKRDVTLSRFQAVNAASGLSGGEDIAAEIAGYGSYQADLARAAGLMRERDRLNAAAASRATGRAQQVGSYFSAGGTILGGLASGADWYMKYGGGAKTATSAGWYG